MLRIYSVAVEMCRDAAIVAKLIEKHDRDLACQLRRAATSVVLNIAEGSGSFGGNRKQRYHSAMGSAYEVRACFDSAEAMQYVEAIDEGVRERTALVVNTLIKVLGLSR
jgi:four helix bundle protein